MNIALWVVQVLLAMHTAMGAVWKFSNSEQATPSLSAIPHAVWMGLIGVELLASVGLLLPAAVKSLGMAVPVAAGVVALEMLMFCAVHLASGQGKPGELVYWGVVAVVCAFVAYGRVALKPL